MLTHTVEGFHCMDCGRPLPQGQIVCKDCLKAHKKRGDKFTMTPHPAGVQKMEHLD